MLRRTIAGLLLATCLTVGVAPHYAMAGTRPSAGAYAQLQTLAQPGGGESPAPAQVNQLSGAAQSQPSDQRFRNIIRRLLFLEALRLLLMQISGFDLSVLGDDFWFQIYLRVVARGLDATLTYDAATGTSSLIKGNGRVDIRPGDGNIIISNGTTTVLVPGNLSTGAAGSFWKVCDMIYSFIKQAQDMIPPLPPMPAHS